LLDRVLVAASPKITSSRTRRSRQRPAACERQKLRALLVRQQPPTSALPRKSSNLPAPGRPDPTRRFREMCHVKRVVSLFDPMVGGCGRPESFRQFNPWPRSPRTRSERFQSWIGHQSPKKIGPRQHLIRVTSHRAAAVTSTATAPGSSQSSQSCALVSLMYSCTSCEGDT